MTDEQFKQHIKILHFQNWILIAILWVGLALLLGLFLSANTDNTRTNTRTKTVCATYERFILTDICII